MIRYNVAVFRESLVTDGALSILLGNLAIQQLTDLSLRAEFAISSGVVRIFNALYASPHTPLFARLLAAAAEARAVDRTVFVSAKFHRQHSNTGSGDLQEIGGSACECGGSGHMLIAACQLGGTDVGWDVIARRDRARARVAP